MPLKITWRSKLLLAGGGLLLGLVTAEVALHALGLPRFHKAHTAPPQFLFFRDPVSGSYFYVNAPSTTIAFRYDSDPRGYFGPGNVVNHVTNSLGFRGPEFSLTKPPGTIRLVFLGDSFTFGEGVHFEDTFAEVSRRLLAAQLGRGDRSVESYNLGVSGYNTTDELFLLKRIGLLCRPDAVVLCYVLNDAEPELFRIDSVRGPVRRSRESWIPEGVSDAKPPRTLLYDSRIAQLIWRYFNSRKLNRETETYYHRLYAPGAGGWKQTQDSLREMASICRRAKIPFMVMVFPVLDKLGKDYPFQDIHRTVDAAAKSDGATVLDLLPTFQGHRAVGLWVHPTDQHPNEIAHRMAAEQLADRLESWPEFLRRISPSAYANASGTIR